MEVWSAVKLSVQSMAILCTEAILPFQCSLHLLSLDEWGWGGGGLLVSCGRGLMIEKNVLWKRSQSMFALYLPECFKML
jgi:hypothetical protein